VLIFRLVEQYFLKWKGNCPLGLKQKDRQVGLRTTSLASTSNVASTSNAASTSIAASTSNAASTSTSTVARDFRKEYEDEKLRNAEMRDRLHELSKNLIKFLTFK
jgi:hypothetical protein